MTRIAVVQRQVAMLKGETEIAKSYVRSGEFERNSDEKRSAAGSGDLEDSVAGFWDSGWGLHGPGGDAGKFGGVLLA